jgi:PAS domain S-box-containing protein
MAPRDLPVTQLTLAANDLQSRADAEAFVASHIVSEETIRLALEACPTGMIVTEASGRIILVNAEVERLFGYCREELLGKPIETFVPSHREANGVHPQAHPMGRGQSLLIVRKDGTELSVEIDLHPIRTSEGTVVLSIITDISERKRKDAALHRYTEREQLFIAVVESSDDAIVTKTLDGVITGWNQAAERLFGFSAQEAIGKSIDIIVPDELRSEVRMNLDRIRRGEKVDHHETTRTGRDGRRIDVSLSISPVKSPTGEIVGATKVTRDITAQKRDQRALAKRSEDLQRSNADLEQFAYVASHDLQEPLRMVSTYTQLLLEHYEGALDEKARKYMNYTLDGSQRMRQLIKDLLAYSRVDTEGKTPGPIQSGMVVKNVLDSLKITIEESHAEIVYGDLPSVRADKVQLAQVFQNLIGNALKFRGERPPHIHISAEQSNDKWTFRVEDNGIGIDKQYSEVVFQMFRRLHERDRYVGNGIGLAITKKIVERHGGRIWFDSDLEKGSTFYFTMPAAEGDIA